MIKTLVVDDENLVRRGLISMMPWDKFGIEIVGEASNGRKALELMSSRSVDLLFTDLVMPEMSGFDLMKAVREAYPDTAFVILTCHEDFSFVKDAIRLGALDYIVKNDLETEMMDEVLARVVSKFQSTLKRDGAKPTARPETGYLVYVPDTRLLDTYWWGEWLLKCHCIDKHFYFIDSEAYATAAKERLASFGEDVALVRMVNLGGASLSDVLRFVSVYKDNGFFYDYRLQRHMFEINAETIQPGNVDPIEQVQKLALSFGWVYLDREYGELKQAIVDCRPSPHQLKTIFFQFILENGHLFVAAELATTWISQLADIAVWQRFEIHLDALRTIFRGISPHEQHTEEVVRGIVKAIYYMQHHDAFNFTQNDLADMVNMSRPYFSINFKSITGKSFTDYLRDLRLAKAKRLLLQTNKPIYWVAEQTGFKDERYFSKLFSQHVGMVPSDFRNQRLNPLQ